jgi:hypothetical protein
MSTQTTGDGLMTVLFEDDIVVRALLNVLDPSARQHRGRGALVVLHDQRFVERPVFGPVHGADLVQRRCPYCGRLRTDGPRHQSRRPGVSSPRA